MTLEMKKIHRLAEQEQQLWTAALRSALKPYWQKTLKDDKNGLLSLLPEKISAAAKKPAKEKRQVRKLGAAALYFWTAANLQDDLSDEADTPKKYLPLANVCLRTAWRLSNGGKIILTAKSWRRWEQALLLADNANFSELSSPLKIPGGRLAPAGKSSFLLAGPVLLAAHLNWPEKDQKSLFSAGQHFLAAKQLADDVYDYREDWQAGRRNFAHRGWKRLPNRRQLPAYYQKQAADILALCRRSREILKTIPALKTEDCFDDFLKPLEINCSRALAKLYPKIPTH